MVKALAQVSCTPPQIFNVLLSTGSADFWVTAFNVSTNKPRFFPQNSSTFSLPTPQKYLNLPSIQGIVGVDTIQFAGLSQAKLEFSFADIIENQTLAHPFDGIMGLTFPELSKSATKTRLWLLLIIVKLLKQKMFTLYLKGVMAVNKKICQAVWLLLAVLTRKIVGKNWGRLNFLEEYNTNSPLIASVVKEMYSVNTTQAVSDSSTSVIFGNINVTDQIAKQFGAVWNDHDELYKIDCNANASLTFRIGGVDYTMTKVYSINHSKCSNIPLEPIYRIFPNTAPFSIRAPFSNTAPVWRMVEKYSPMGLYLEKYGII
uniref:Peptidase A1 domain-containing protein n=1 Tax=Meloidogyne enterolobii TaxID=390850 RepID=A0A6V7W4V8_MELEN|nr:unnamed protein product [Meloidogyne enterolobii]